MSAPTPRMPDGRPDFSGTWTSDEVDPRKPGVPPNPHDATTSRRMINLGVELQEDCRINPGSPRWSRSARRTTRKTTRTSGAFRTTSCAPWTPHLLKFVQTPAILLVLNEWNAGYRQIFTDGRPLPEDPNPSWQGYSSAKWDGDALVIDTIGIRDDTWIDWNGSVLTEAAKVREEFRRPDLGHLEVKVTVDDPKAYTKPWTVLIKERLIVDRGI